MGAYLSVPITDKDSEEGMLKEGILFGVSSMQVQFPLPSVAHDAHAPSLRHMRM